MYDSARIQDKQKELGIPVEEETKADKPTMGKNSSLQLPNPSKKRGVNKVLSQNNIFKYEEKDLPAKKMISKMASMGIQNDDQINEPDFNLNFLKKW